VASLSGSFTCSGIQALAIARIELATKAVHFWQSKIENVCPPQVEHIFGKKIFFNFRLTGASSTIQTLFCFITSNLEGPIFYHRD